MKNKLIVFCLIVVLSVAFCAFVACGGEEFVVTFRPDGGEATFELKQEVRSGKTATKPSPDPTRADYTFKWWSVVGDSERAEYDFSTPITEDTYLIAIWILDTVTVSFYSGEEVHATQSISKGSTATAADGPTRVGYVFAYWALKSDTSKAEFNFSTVINNDLELVAVWTIGSVTVSFDSDEGSDVDAQTITTLTTATKPSNPTKDGYKFLYWSVKGQDEPSAYDFSTPVDTNLELIAIWEFIEPYAVIDVVGDYRASNGSTLRINSDATGKIMVGSSETKITKLEFVLAALVATTTTTAKVTFEYDNTLKTLTVTAGGNSGFTVGVSFVLQVTVSFSANGGVGEYQTQVLDYGDIAEEPSNPPTREGYAFRYWVRADVPNQEYYFIAVKEDLELIASWRQLADLSAIAGVWSGEQSYTHIWTLTIGAGESLSVVRRAISTGVINTYAVSDIKFESGALSFAMSGSNYTLTHNNAVKTLTRSSSSSNFPSVFTLASKGLVKTSAGNNMTEISGVWQAEVRLQPSMFSHWTLTIDGTLGTVSIVFARALDGRQTTATASNVVYNDHILSFNATIADIQAGTISFRIEFFDNRAISLEFASSHLSAGTMFYKGAVPVPTGWGVIAGTWVLMEISGGGSRTWLLKISAQGEVLLIAETGMVQPYGNPKEISFDGTTLSFKIDMQEEQYHNTTFRLKLVDNDRFLIEFEDYVPTTLQQGDYFERV